MTSTGRQCEFPGCERKHHAKGLCARHHQLQRQGKKLRPLQRIMNGATISEKLQEGTK